eukprot:scaffold1877_cov140-Isochrysis_galbana.AAC.5
MSWDEWVDVQMEARPISGRANQASRTLFHGPRVALRAEQWQWLSQSMRPRALGLGRACWSVLGCVSRGC